MTIKHMAGAILRRLFPRKMAHRDREYGRKKALQELPTLQAMTQEQVANRIKERYRENIGHELNLEDPKCFTEKIQWRKLYDCDPIYSQLSDKYRVREWVAKKIGEEYLIPLLGVWERFEDIDFDKLPEKFVLKTNNACATNTIVTDKSKVDRRQMAEDYRFWMQAPFGYYSMERHYNAIKPLIIAEKYIEPENGESDLKDYKFLCFHGKPHYCWVDVDRYHNHKRKAYSLNWNAEPWTMGPYGFCEQTIPKPQNLEKMIALAERLSAGFAHVRVDFYEIRGKIYFGEMTFTSASGYGRFSPREWDSKLGDLWDITVPQIDREPVGL